MENLFVKETWVNETEGYISGNTQFYESFTDNRGELYRSLVKEYGRCISKMYTDLPDESGKSKPIGWVFEARKQYTDCKDTYLCHTWVEVR